MREIKFRIFSDLFKTWHYWDVYGEYPQGIYGGVSEPQQFTGLKDKNNEEIYEGDFLEIYGLGPVETSKPSYGLVEWSNEENVEAEFVINTPYGYRGFDYAEIKVIGNLMENEIKFCITCKQKLRLRQKSRLSIEFVRLENEFNKSISCNDYHCFSCYRKYIND